MSQKTAPMEWNVFYYNFNANRIEAYNVLRGRAAFLKELKKRFPARENFAKELRSEMMYYYWSRTEWEILLSPWIGSREPAERKIDVFDQLQLNWDRFVDYCWSAA